MIETKDYITWAITLSSIGFNFYQYFDGKKTKANIIMSIAYPQKIEPSLIPRHPMDLQEPLITPNPKYIELHITNIGRESLTLKKLCIIIDGKLFELIYVPNLIMYYRDSANLKGDELKDYEYGSSVPLGKMDGESELFVTIRANIFSRNITRIFARDIIGNEWDLSTDKLKSFLEQFDKGNPIRFVDRTV